MSTNNETHVHPGEPAAPCMRPLAVQAAEDRAGRRRPRPLPCWNLRPAQSAGERAGRQPPSAIFPGRARHRLAEAPAAAEVRPDA